MVRGETLAERRAGWITACFVVVCIVLGGGGTPNAATEIALETLAGLFATLWLWNARTRVDRKIALLALCIVIVPLLQILPLPAAAWQALPGRAAVEKGLALAGEANSWRAATLSPGATMASLLSLGPPLLAMVMVASLDGPGRRRVLWAIAAAGLAASLLGAWQLSSGDAAPRFYPQTHTGVVTATFANRNAAADLLLIAMVAAACAARSIAPERKPLVWLSLGLMAAAVFFTASRAGIVLILPVLAGCWIMLRTSGSRRAWRWIAAAGGLGLLTALIASLRAREVFARFVFGSDARLGLWRDAWEALAIYWPAGSGMGTGRLVLERFERIEALDPTVPNRVHNDWLEFLLEAGAPGVVVLVVCAVLLAAILRAAWRDREGAGVYIPFAGLTLAVLAAHSLVDYPLRAMALAVLAGVAAGSVARLPEAIGSGGDGRSRRASE